MNYRGMITDSVKFELYKRNYNAESVNDIIECLVVELSKYDFTPAERHLVVYDTSDKEMVAKFFLAKGAQGLSQRSIKLYKLQIKAFLDFVRKHIKDIDANDIRMYLGTKRVQGISPTSLDNIRLCISTFFSFLKEENFIERDYSKMIKKIRPVKKIRKPFSEEEMERIREAAQQTKLSTRNLALVEFFYSTGCRVGEVAGLNFEDVDLENQEASVLGKGNKMRIVYLSPRCVHYMKKYASEIKVPTGPFFKSSNGKFQHRLTVGGIGTIMDEIQKKTNIHVHPHRFRRTAATIALRRGMSLEMVGKMLGHSSMNTTKIYAESEDADLKYAHKKFLT